MIYEIQNENDFLTGASVVIKIPESELDKKALYTIQTEKPEFLISFAYRKIDGQIEFTYHIGSQSKIQYLSGMRSPKEYALFWSGILTPLLNCGDWFIKPYSFLLDIEHLYYDKNKKAVCYIYVPSIRDCSESGAIKGLAIEVSKHISVTDADLENKVIRTIMKDFYPKDFLQMLESGVSADMPPVTQSRAPELSVIHIPEQAPEQVIIEQVDISMPEITRIEPRKSIPGVGDIIIDIPVNGKTAKKPKRGTAEWIDAAEKKDQKKTKSPLGLFESKKDKRHNAPAEIPATPRYEPEPVFIPSPDCHVISDYYPSPVYAPVSDCARTPGSGDATQCVRNMADGSRFRLVGSVLLPPMINIQISAGRVFTIGRFDAVIGRQQSDFEFDKKTKAVSRRHAAIERSADSYTIVDLSSSAGTFLDGRRLPPNMPCELKHGCRVSFGNAGADYVWEE